MRTIKFRAWDEKTDTIRKVEAILWDGADVDYVAYEDLNGEPNWQADFQLMQFTGLHDKNGKEIYFGDLITCEGHGDGKGGKAVTEIRWDEEEAQIDLPRHEDGSRYNPTKYEIIGNIYENPELLKP